MKDNTMNRELMSIARTFLIVAMAYSSLTAQEGSGTVDTTYYPLVDTPPVLIGGSDAIQSRLLYPEIARRAGVQGTVYVGAYVDETGRVVKTEILKSISQKAGFEHAALNAVRDVKFIPGKRDGRPVKCLVAIPVKFRLTTLETSAEAEQENVREPSVFIVQGPNLKPLIGYPRESIKAGIEGTVFAKVYLDARLNPRSVSLLSGVDAPCNREVMRAVISYDYTRDTKIRKSTVDTILTVGVRFVLPKK